VQVRTRRWAIVIVIVALIAGLAGMVAYMARPVVSVSTAYKAKMLCSDIFVAGRSRGDVLADLQIDDLRHLRVIQASIDSATGTTTAGLFSFAERRARHHGELGCVLEPGGARSTTELSQGSSLRRMDTPATPAVAFAAVPASVRRTLEVVIDDAFAEPDAAHQRRTRAVVVMQHGEIVAERYASGIDSSTPLPGWSMAKSVLNALVGIAVREGKLAVDAPVGLKAWNTPGDPRARITVDHLLR
jgi:hypothetical protein